MSTFFKSHWPFLFGLFLSLILLWPLLYAPYFSHHDDVQTIRLYELDKCIKDLQIPCRWVPDLGGGYGYPLFNYYGPLPYYYGEIFYLLTQNLIVSAKVMFATAFIGAYLFSFLLGRKLWGELGGTLSAIFYSFAPYHAVVLYVRGAMGELWGLMFFPALLWSFLRLKQTPSLGNSLLFGLLLAMITMSHNLSTLMFLPFLVMFVLFLVIQNGFKLKFFKALVVSLMLGVLISAFYTVPMIFERDLVHVETTTYGYFSFTEHFKGIRKLFLERSWGYGASVREVPGGEKDGLSFQIGIVHVITWVLAMLAAVKLFQRLTSVSSLVLFFSLAIVGAIFLIHPLSSSVWQLVGPMKYFQFPWRFLMMVILFISLMPGFVLTVFEKYRYQLFAVLSLAVIVLNFNYFRPEKFFYLNDQDILTGQNWDRLIKRSIYDFLPIFAKEPPAKLSDADYHIVTGDTKISNFEKGTNWINFTAHTNTHSIVMLSQYYFPDWEVKVDGKPVNIEYNNNHLGLINFILGFGEHNISAALHDTLIRKLANFLSAAGFIIFIFLAILQVKRIKHWLRYYIKALHT